MIYPLQATLRPADPILSGIAAAYANESEDFLQDKLLPTLVDGSSAGDGGESYTSGIIQRLADDALFGDPTRTREIARGQPYQRGRGANYNPLAFQCQKFGGEQAIYWEDGKINNAGFANAVVQLESEVRTQRILREAAFRALFMANATWNTVDLTGVVGVPGANQFQRWNVAGSNPNVAIEEACSRVRRFGRRPNMIVMSEDIRRALILNAAFNNFMPTTVDRTLLTDQGLRDVLASRFNLTEVHIGAAIGNTSGVPGTLTPGYIWDEGGAVTPFGGVWIGMNPMDANGPAQNVAVADNDLGLLQTTPMAAGRVQASGWEVVPYPEEQTDSMVYKLRYMEWIGQIQRNYGQLLTRVLV